MAVGVEEAILYKKSFVLNYMYKSPESMKIGSKVYD